MIREEIGFVSDLWVVSLRDEMRIVGARAPYERCTVGQSLAEMLCTSECERLLSYASSYEEAPLLLETIDGKLLLVLSALIPSCTNALVLVPQFDRKTLLRFLAKRSQAQVLFGEKLAKEAEGRVTGRVLRESDELAVLEWELQSLSAKELFPRTRRKGRRIDRFLWERAELLACLTGCSVCLREPIKILESEEFDYGAFTNFLLCSLLLCRSAAYERCAEIAWEDHAVTVRFSCDPIPRGASPELDSLEAFAEEEQLHLGNDYADGRLCLSLPPRKIDFSYLGLKAKNSLT